MGFFFIIFAMCVCVYACGGAAWWGWGGVGVFVTVCHFIYSEWRMRSKCQRHYMLYKGS